jgi:hypothetical protein
VRTCRCGRFRWSTGLGRCSVETVSRRPLRSEELPPKTPVFRREVDIMSEDPRAGLDGPNALPQTELLVGGRGLSARCPYCDTVVPLDGPHECPECGATADVSVRWSL